jgi:transposase
MNTQYVGKTAAVLEIMQRTGVGRFVIERKMNEMEGAGDIRFLDDPRDIRKKLISREHVEEVVRALSPM